MPETRRPPRIFTSAAEQSGDEHAAELILAAGHAIPGAAFIGLAGPAMQAAGCACIHDLTARAAMALGAIGRIPEAIRALRRVRSVLAEGGFDAAVLVDSPAFNMHVARTCGRLGVPVLYYIAPQTWAWAPWRNTAIRRRVNRLACIWPFEESYFRGHGIPAKYVGHPSFDRILANVPDEARVAEMRAGSSPVVVLLPGSRRHVVEEVLPGQRAVAEALSRRFHKARFILVASNEQMRERVAAMASRDGRQVRIDVRTGDAERAAAIRAADLVLAASGTVTLEVAYHATPMIVMYNASRWLYHLVGRWLVSTPHYSIPNILAGREIVPEFMPYYRSPDPIIARALELLSTPAKLRRMRDDLRAAIGPIVKPGASKNAAGELAAMLSERPLSGRDGPP